MANYDTMLDTLRRWGAGTEGLRPLTAEALAAIAASRTLREGRPAGRRERDPLTEAGRKALIDTLVPQSTLDVGMLALGGPMSRAAKIAALAAGGAAASDPAEAGPSATVRRAVSASTAARAGRGATISATDAPAVDYVRGLLDPTGMPHPGIWKSPRDLAADVRIAPEHEGLKRLFGVTRDDLYEIGERGTRAGNMPAQIATVANPKGSYVAERLMTAPNAERLVEALKGAEKRVPDLVRGMDSWYVMDPLYWRMEQLMGKRQAPEAYRHLNTLTSMASPGSNVLTEINRGTAAHWLDKQGQFNVFEKYAGKPPDQRPARYREMLAGISGHPYHSTSQAGPMADYLAAGMPQMQSPKVPLYIQASGVPQTGFQTTLPVPDAHFARAIGAADVREGLNKGESLRRTEYPQIGPWFRGEVAEPLGIQAVPAQARMWGLYGPQTGVETPVGAPKLELFAQRIMERAHELGIKPEKLRDMVLKGGAHAGIIGGAAVPFIGSEGQPNAEY